MISQQYWKKGDVYHTGFFTIKKYHGYAENNLKDVDLYLTASGADDKPTLEEKKGKYSLIQENFCSEHALGI